MQVRAQLAQKSVVMESRNFESQWGGGGQAMNAYSNMSPISSQSSLESAEHSINDAGINNIQDAQRKELDFSFPKKRSYNNDLGELHQLALRMMRN